MSIYVIYMPFYVKACAKHHFYDEKVMFFSFFCTCFYAQICIFNN